MQMFSRRDNLGGSQPTQPTIQPNQPSNHPTNQPNQPSNPTQPFNQEIYIRSLVKQKPLNIYSTRCL